MRAFMLVVVGLFSGLCHGARSPRLSESGSLQSSTAYIPNGPAQGPPRLSLSQVTFHQPPLKSAMRPWWPSFPSTELERVKLQHIFLEPRVDQEGLRLQGFDVVISDRFFFSVKHLYADDWEAAEWAKKKAKEKAKARLKVYRANSNAVPSTKPSSATQSTTSNPANGSERLNPPPRPMTPTPGLASLSDAMRMTSPVQMQPSEQRPLSKGMVGSPPTSKQPSPNSSWDLWGSLSGITNAFLSPRSGKPDSTVGRSPSPRAPASQPRKIERPSRRDSSPKFSGSPLNQSPIDSLPDSPVASPRLQSLESQNWEELYPDLFPRVSPDIDLIIRGELSFEPRADDVLEEFHLLSLDEASQQAGRRQPPPLTTVVDDPPETPSGPRPLRFVYQAHLDAGVMLWIQDMNSGQFWAAGPSLTALTINLKNLNDSMVLVAIIPVEAPSSPSKFAAELVLPSTDPARNEFPRWTNLEAARAWADRYQSPTRLIMCARLQTTHSHLTSYGHWIRDPLGHLNPILTTDTRRDAIDRAMILLDPRNHEGQAMARDGKQLAETEDHLSIFYDRTSARRCVPDPEGEVGAWGVHDHGRFFICYRHQNTQSSILEFF